MVFTFDACLILLLLGTATSTPAADSCPAFGTEFPRSQSSYSATGLWLNFDTPAQCTGIAAQWRFCYYVLFTDRNQEVWLRVYRKRGASNTYDKVEDSRVNRRYVDSGDLSIYDAVCDGGSPPYCCETLTVSIPIQENDIIGVCMRVRKSYEPLYSVDEGAPAEYKTYPYSQTEKCSGAVASFMMSDLGNPIIGYGIHAILSIEADTAACSVGSNPPPFTASTTSGLYLNLESPAQCNGLITTWHYCYYPPSVAGNRSFTVGVWRLNQVAQQYNLVGSSKTFTVMAETSFASVICGTETLIVSDYVSVNENDCIGVSIPPSDLLPVVASGASDYGLKRFVNENAVSVESAVLQDLPNQALHLHADILMMTATPVPAATTTAVPATTALNIGFNSTVQPTFTPTQLRNDNVRIVISTAVPMGVVLTACLAIVTIVVCTLRRRKVKKVHIHASQSVLQSEVTTVVPLIQLSDNNTHFVYSDNQAYASSMQASSTHTALGTDVNCKGNCNPSYATTRKVQAFALSIQGSSTHTVLGTDVNCNGNPSYTSTGEVQAFTSSMQASGTDTALGTDVNCKDNPSNVTTGEVQDSQYEYVVNEVSHQEDYQYDYIDQDTPRNDSRNVDEEVHTYYILRFFVL